MSNASGMTKSDITLLLDRCCPGWDNWEWNEPCTAPLSKALLEEKEARRNVQMSLCMELRRYFHKKKQKAMIFYGRWENSSQWVIVHKEAGIVRLKDFSIDTLPGKRDSFYQNMPQSGKAVLDKWYEVADFFFLHTDAQTNIVRLAGFEYFELWKNRAQSASFDKANFIEAILEIYAALRPTGYVLVDVSNPNDCLQNPPSETMSTPPRDERKVTEKKPPPRLQKGSEAEKKLQTEKMDELFPNWSDPAEFTCYTYPPVYEPTYQGPTEKRLQLYVHRHKTLMEKLDVEISAMVDEKHQSSEIIQARKTKKEREIADAKDRNYGLKKAVDNAKGSAAESLVLMGLKRAFARHKEKAFILTSWDFPTGSDGAEFSERYKQVRAQQSAITSVPLPDPASSSSAENVVAFGSPNFSTLDSKKPDGAKTRSSLPDVDVLVIHKHGLTVFEVKSAETVESRRKATEQLDTILCAFKAYGIDTQYIKSFIFYQSSDAAIRETSLPHNQVDKTWLEKLSTPTPTNQICPLVDLWPASEEPAFTFDNYKQAVEKIVMPKILDYSILNGYDKLELALLPKLALPPPPDIFPKVNQMQQIKRKPRGLRPVFFLNCEQQDIWNGGSERFMYGEAGTGKTILLQYKCLELLKSSSKDKAIILAPPKLATQYEDFLLRTHEIESDRLRIVHVSKDDPFLSRARQIISAFLPCHVFIDEGHLCFFGMAQELYLMWKYKRDNHKASLPLSRELHFWAAALPDSFTGDLLDTLPCTELKVSLRSARNLQLRPASDSNLLFDLNVYGELIDGEYIVIPPGKHDVTEQLHKMVIKSAKRFKSLGIQENSIAVISSAAVEYTSNLETGLKREMRQLQCYTGNYDSATPFSDPHALNNTHDIHSLEFQAAITICDPDNRNMDLSKFDAAEHARSRGVIGLSIIRCLPVYRDAKADGLVFTKTGQRADLLIYESAGKVMHGWHFAGRYIRASNPCLLLAEAFKRSADDLLKKLETLNQKQKRFRIIRYARSVPGQINQEKNPGAQYVFVFPHATTLSRHDLDTLFTPGIMVRLMCVVFNASGKREVVHPYTGSVPDYDDEF
ncbi:uncharacterized protein LOC129602054 [Paramacrobiotus metropolitanus]|uniref:uncharacterized protein LOC129602054 n=1 Tax=Paramacrobiotus metropolitanus TaxID=2943436 RepID=UPI0024463072|nr:uncharacterized protein LOC129602054 [Paramacrobiotus metropolitanus]XP_055356983.1 uncharacterized protein LOC129602054 [Paramacrobiotus metropolitanus]XP_055356984.1 uncharacterized protein LOC129602054 [Paramacrobiotus metropolitanus]XP_055356985.1 uncharacterized protein LOC129602054 [Paramacrobiotus metropolitanus]XP_055356986.1 uncharacterized protein LOC129602054 [Paramacrobiotus metropolitanus]